MSKVKQKIKLHNVQRFANFLRSFAFNHVCNYMTSQIKLAFDIVIACRLKDEKKCNEMLTLKWYGKSYDL